MDFTNSIRDFTLRQVLFWSDLWFHGVRGNMGVRTKKVFASSGLMREWFACTFTPNKPLIHAHGFT